MACDASELASISGALLPVNGAIHGPTND